MLLVLAALCGSGGAFALVADSGRSGSISICSSTDAVAVAITAISAHAIHAHITNAHGVGLGFAVLAAGKGSPAAALLLKKGRKEGHEMVGHY